MPLDPRIKVALEALPPRAASTLSPAERREDARSRGKDMSGVLSEEVAPLPEEHDTVVLSPSGAIPIRIYRPHDGELPCLIFLHGGGWWLGTLDENDSLCRRRANDADCVVVAVDYRLAPENPYPAPLDDCWTVTQWVFEQADQLGVDRARVAVAGGSAGGNLAAAVTLLARDDATVSLAAQVLEVPATDLTLTASRSSVDEFAMGYGLTKDDLTECVEFYLGGHDPTDPLASPLLADLHELPAALVMTAEYDPVRDDGEAYAAKLAAAGVPVTLHRWDGTVHGAFELDVLLPDMAHAYREEVRQFLRSAFAADREPTDSFDGARR